MFDDPFCTKMEELESEGFGAVMEVPFCAPVNTCGKSFVDDKSYMARTHAGLVQLFMWAEKYNGFTGTEMKPPKGGVQSLVPMGKGYAAAKDLPDLIVHLFEADKDMVIPRYEPDEPMKYLGILSTVLLSWGWAVDAAMEVADRVALCIKNGSKWQSISHRLMCTVAAPAALYKLMVASIGERDMQEVQSKCYIACKAALGLARSTPNDVVSAVVSLDWWNLGRLEHPAGHVKLLAVSDGSLRHRGFAASATSQRAELQGLLSVLIGVELSGWCGSVVLRLDNEAA